ncbi:MAG: response regulator transcription factor [Bacteroidota bacterium]|jgi:DNA-binding NarL/FixJ family response regulator
MKKTTIVIADDHVLIAEAWSFLLSQFPDLEVLKLYDNTQTLLDELDVLKPDIVILDVNILPYSGLETTTMIRKKLPETKVIGISMHNEVGFANRMLENGACAYITKNSHQDEMFFAIREALTGRTYICKEIRERMK